MDMAKAGAAVFDTIGFDQLGYPEYADERPLVPLSDLLREDGNVHREHFVPVPTDGSVKRHHMPWKAYSCDVINSSGQVLLLGDEKGDVIRIGAGAIVSLPLPGASFFTFQTAAADVTGGSVYVVFYAYRRPLSGLMAGGTSITSPLDSEGALFIDQRGVAGFANGPISVGTTLTQLVPARVNRTRLLISNLDATNFITVGTGAASLTNALKVRPTDVPLVLKVNTAVSAIAFTAAVQVGVVEEFS